MNDNTNTDIENSFWTKQRIREPQVIFYDVWTGTIKIKIDSIFSQTKSHYDKYYRIKATLLQKSFKDKVFNEGEEYIFHLPAVTFEKQIIAADFDRRFMKPTTRFILTLSKSGKQKALRILSAQRVD